MLELIERLAHLPQSFFIYLLLLLINSLLGVVFYKRLSKSFRLVTQLIIVTFISEFSGAILIQVELFTSNFLFYHCLQPLQLLYNGIIYLYILKEQSFTRKYLISITIFLVLISIIISFSIQYVDKFPSYGSFILSLFIVVNSLVLYAKMIKSPIETSILKQEYFWFNSGNFFFYTVTFLAFGYFEYVQEQNDGTPEWVMLIIKGSNFVLYGCYGISIYLAALNQKKNNG